MASPGGSVSSASPPGVAGNEIYFRNDTRRQCHVEVVRSEWCSCFSSCIPSCLPWCSVQAPHRVFVEDIAPGTSSKESFQPSMQSSSWVVRFSDHTGNLIDEVGGVTCEFFSVRVRLTEVAGGKALACIENSNMAPINFSQGSTSQRMSSGGQSNPFAAVGFGAGLLMGGGFGATAGVAAAGGFGPSRW
eukprot:gnl/MRDRNA2_/MRDRNA2_337016_c0_seq1.p1 gnl/MRDRNA2_/MRDRNA2_337016_c0~~gnl/MRDRNA2_/MRDRNA2_337016_c0_seq1.p1  ORF type:complete len:189 (+),score=30.56 gnl/MRDRNA2_/MRDRNA2_337016_c0_seq1:128-694(+)